MTDDSRAGLHGSPPLPLIRDMPRGRPRSSVCTPGAPRPAARGPRVDSAGRAATMAGPGVRRSRRGRGGTVRRAALRPPATVALAAALAALLLPVGTASAATTASAGSASGTVTLEVRTGIPAAHASLTAVRAVAARVAGAAARTDDALARIGFATVTVPAADAASTAAALAATYGSDAVTASPERRPFFTPNDPRWLPRQATALGAVAAPAAWDVARGDGVTIAVVDGGFDAGHPDVAAKVVGTHDVVDGGSAVADSPGDPLPGHGTAVASVAAAVTNNGIGIAGAAPDAGLLLLKAADSTGRITAAAVATAIVYAVDHGASVVNISLGDPTPDTAEQAAVDYAVAHGVLVVAAAGNNGNTVKQYPAACTGAVSAGATTSDGTTRASFSTYGSWVTVAAPGVGIPIALPLAYDTHDDRVDGYSVWDGTSFSSPIVGAEAALIRSLHPAFTLSDVVAAITDTTTGPALGFGHGLVQYAAALAQAPRLQVSATASPRVFSPNGDGRVDTTSVRYSVDQSQTATASVFAADGSKVAGPVALGTVAAGAHTWIWDGHDAHGRTVGEGVYRIQVRTSARVGGTQLDGLAASYVRVDLTPPELTGAHPGRRVIYPRRDGYADSAGLGATSSEALSSFSVVVSTMSGRVVRRLYGGAHAAGRFAVLWDGRTASGRGVPSGRYKFRVSGTDAAGNRRFPVPGYVLVSWHAHP
ncbi:MAG: S8 family serine peptidase [Frankiales bacterium]|nr:S8 family serine peptidase [Frankiales bacterium]